MKKYVLISEIEYKRLKDTPSKVVEPVLETKVEPVVEPVLETKVEPVVEPVLETKVEPVVETVTKKQKGSGIKRKKPQVNIVLRKWKKLD